MHRVVVAGVVFAGVAALLVARFFAALAPTVARERGAACLALESQPVGKPAAPFSLPDEKGRARGPADLRGKVVLLNFWATWCPPCVDEMPSLEALARRMKGRPFELVAVSVDKTWDEIRTFFAGHGDGKTALTVLLDEKGETPHRYGTEKFPESFLLDRDGKVVHRFVNKRDWSSEAAIACVESLLR